MHQSHNKTENCRSSAKLRLIQWSLPWRVHMLLQVSCWNQKIGDNFDNHLWGWGDLWIFPQGNDTLKAQLYWGSDGLYLLFKVIICEVVHLLFCQAQSFLNDSPIESHMIGLVKCKDIFPISGSSLMSFVCYLRRGLYQKAEMIYLLWESEVRLRVADFPAIVCLFSQTTACDRWAREIAHRSHANISQQVLINCQEKPFGGAE